MLKAIANNLFIFILFSVIVSYIFAKIPKRVFYYNRWIFRERKWHYGRTLGHRAKNFENALPEIMKSKDETFIRMWQLYLNACAASFNSGNIDIHQFLFTKGVNNELPWTREYMYK